MGKGLDMRGRVMGNRRWLSLALVALLLGSIVAGCGKDDKGSGDLTESACAGLVPVGQPRWTLPGQRQRLFCG